MFFSNIREMSNCSRYIPVLIWGLGSSLLIGFTIRDFIPLYNDYNYNNVLARIDIKHEPAERPEVTVCLPRYSYALRKIAEWMWNSTKNGTSDCLECDQMKGRGWDVWNEMGFGEFPGLSVSRIEGKIATAIVKKLLTFSNSEEFAKYATLNRSNFNWNQPIIDAIRLFLCALDEQSMMYVAWPSTLVAPPCLGTFDLSQLGRLNSRDIDRLSKYVINAFFTYVKFQIFYGNDSRVVMDSLAGRQIYVQNALTCFTVLKNSSSEWYYYVPFLDANDPPWIRYRRREPFIILRDSSGLYSSKFPYNRLLYSTDQSKIREIKGERVSLMYSVATRVSEGRVGQNCSQEPNAARCVLQARMKVAEDRCGCRPFLPRQYGLVEENTILPYCNESTYSSCDELEKSAKTIYELCYRKCEHTFYSWEQKSHTEIDYKRKFLVFAVRIETGDTNVPFIEFTMTVKDSFQKFLSQIGGIVNLYLGISGISVCGLVVLAVRAAQKYFNGRHQSRSDLELEREAAIRMRQYRRSDSRKSIEKLLKQVTEDLSNRIKIELAQITDQMNIRMEKIERKMDEIESQNVCGTEH